MDFLHCAVVRADPTKYSNYWKAPKRNAIALSFIAGTKGTRLFDYYCPTPMPEKTEKWYSFEKEREGRLLHLRFPPKTDYRTIQPKLPRLVWVTYKATEFPDPEPSFEAFHRSLMPLDDHIVFGLPSPVLIETFRRMRTYYSYAPEDFSFKELQEFTKATFPKEELIWESKLDPNWKLLRSYSQEIGFLDS